MAQSDRVMAPPTRGAPTDPSMMGGPPPATSDLIRQAAGGRGAAPPGGGGGAAQAAQLIASGAQQLIQAAQMFPALSEPIQQAIAILQAGVSQIAQMAQAPGGKGRGSSPRPKKDRTPPPGTEQDQFGAGASGMM